MAGDDDGKGIRGATSTDRPRRAGISQPPGQLTVSKGLSVRNSQQSPPHPDLMFAPAHVQGKLELLSPSVEIFLELPGRLGEMPAGRSLRCGFPGVGRVDPVILRQTFRRKEDAKKPSPVRHQAQRPDGSLKRKG